MSIVKVRALSAQETVRHAQSVSQVTCLTLIRHVKQLVALRIRRPLMEFVRFVKNHVSSAKTRLALVRPASQNIRFTWAQNASNIVQKNTLIMTIMSAYMRVWSALPVSN